MVSQPPRNPRNGDSPKGRASVELRKLDAAAAASAQSRYWLRLYVSGNTARSTAAVANIKRICDRLLKGRYDLEVIDVYQQPRLAREQQLVAAPTLVKERPEPVRRLVGDMSNEERVMIGLDLREIA